MNENLMSLFIQIGWAIALAFGIRWVYYLFLIASPIAAIASIVSGIFFSRIEGAGVFVALAITLLVFSVVTCLILLLNQNVKYYIEAKRSSISNNEE